MPHRTPRLHSLLPVIALLLISASASAAPPALPAGLDFADTDSGSESTTEDSSSQGATWLDNISGFAETRAGDYLHDHSSQQSESLLEARLQMAADIPFSVDLGNAAPLQGNAALTLDLLGDAVADEQDIRLNRGQGWIDLREVWVSLRASEHTDIKLGRQILTWGTGDLLFINDLFPKDWNSFILGRDDEYLKAPSDAVKIALFGDLANLDIVYTPQFDSDRFIDGSRVSYYNAQADDIVGSAGLVEATIPATSGHDDEVALRLHRLFGAREVALYAYQGYWKSPAGVDPASGRALFPALRVWGASLRQPLAAGLFNAEIGYYDSHDDSDGQNPWINNSEWRFLLGYEQELAAELTAGVQLYAEWLQDYDDYRAGVPDGTWQRDEWRHVASLRLTQLLLQQRLNLSLFNFWSPTDEDGHTRLKASYQWDDHWKTEVGSNLFWGEREQTFFGQLDHNDSIFIAIRYSY